MVPPDEPLPFIRISCNRSRKTPADDAAYNARATKVTGMVCEAVVALTKEVPANGRAGDPLGEKRR